MINKVLPITSPFKCDVFIYIEKEKETKGDGTYYEEGDLVNQVTKNGRPHWGAHYKSPKREKGKKTNEAASRLRDEDYLTTTCENHVNSFIPQI